MSTHGLNVHPRVREVVNAVRMKFLGPIVDRGGSKVIQQGQVFKLKAKAADGQPLWAYRYRFEGRGSARPQVGGFASRAKALEALEKVLERLGPGWRAGTVTLGELVDEYLGMHQAERGTMAKLLRYLQTLPLHLGGGSWLSV